MAKKKKQTKTILLVAGAGLLLYYFMGSQTAAAPAAVAPGTAPVVPLPLLPGVNNTPAVAAATPEASGLSPDVLAWAAKTMSPANYSRFQAVMGQFTTAEVSALNDIVINYFETGTPAGAAQTQEWNDWRNKYNINNGTYA